MQQAPMSWQFISLTAKSSASFFFFFFYNSYPLSQSNYSQESASGQPSTQIKSLHDIQGAFWIRLPDFTLHLSPHTVSPNPLYFTLLVISHCTSQLMDKQFALELALTSDKQKKNVSNKRVWARACICSQKMSTCFLSSISLTFTVISVVLIIIIWWCRG